MRIRWRNFELPSKVVPDTETLTSEYGSFVVGVIPKDASTAVSPSIRMAKQRTLRKGRRSK